MPLFDRRPGHLASTDAGLRYARALRRSFTGIARATSEVRASSGRPHLVVRAYTTFLVRWLIPRLGSFQKQHPEIDLSVDSGFSAADLSKGEIDIEIRYGRGAWPNLKVFPIFGDELVPFCSPGLASEFVGKHPADWPKEFPIIVHTRRPDDWDDWFAAQGVSDLPRRRIEFEDLLLAYQAAHDGLGVAITQTRYIATDVAKGALTPVSSNLLRSTLGYYAVCPIEVAENESAMAFIKWLIDESASSTSTP